MLSRLYLFIVLCLSTAVALGEANSEPAVSTSVPVKIAESSDPVSPQQEEARQQVISEEEDPQAQKTTKHQEEAREAVEQEEVKKQASEIDTGSEGAREEVKSEAEEPALKREKAELTYIKDSFTGIVYGSIRLRYRSTGEGSILGDAGSRAGLEGDWRVAQDTWAYARLEAGFNVLDELDILLDPGSGSGESQQGESVFPRLYTVGIETPVVVASFGKSWSTYYKISNFTDRFDSAGSSAVGTFNANTDGGATGTGRADSVLQSLVYIDFTPEKWQVNPFNLNIQFQSGQPIPGVEGVNYQYAFGLSAVLDSRDDYTLGVAYNRARVDELENAAVQAAGIKGDAEALVIGARWFDEKRYIGFTAARLLNHENTDQGTYFIGWGSELYARHLMTGRYWLVGGYNWLVPDKDEVQAGEYELLYGIVGLRYSIDDFNRLAYAEWRIEGTVSESGEELGNIFTIGIRWDF